MKWQTDLQAVLFHRPLERIHDLPTNEDAQVDQEHPSDDDQQLLVLDDLVGEKTRGPVANANKCVCGTVSRTISS